MRAQPRAVDLFGGEGGVTVGLQRAGFKVTAVDNDPARLVDHPADEVIEADAIEYLLAEGRRYAYRHASPTCTGYSQSTAMIPDRVARYGRLIGATREALLTVGGPYTIENVTSAAARAELRDPMMLCWTEFYRPGSVLDADGTPLWMRRHRLWESNVPLSRKGRCNHPPRDRRHPDWIQCAGAYGAARRTVAGSRERRGGYVPSSPDVIGRLLGIDWMTERGLFLSIPPVYAEHVGRQVMSALGENLTEQTTTTTNPRGARHG